MKSTILLICFAILRLESFSQIVGKKMTDPIKIFDSVSVKPGDTLYLGTGTDRRGDFVYIYQPPNIWAGVAEQSLSRTYSNKYAIVKFFKVQHDKRTGDKTVAVVNPFGGLNFIADLEGAITNQEIIAINQRSLLKKKEPHVIVVQQQSQSLADELVKLKKLYDDGTLSKEEYDAAEKKLIDKQ
jgi:hypothetical protein